MNNSINIVASASFNDKKVSKSKKQEYSQRPEVKARKQKWYQKNKEKVKEYLQKPDVKARRQEYHRKWYQLNRGKKVKEYFQRPEVKARRQEYHRKWYQLNRGKKVKEYFQRPDVKARRQEYNQRLDVKAKKREWKRKQIQANREKIKQLKKTIVEQKQENIKYEAATKAKQNKVINQIDDKQMINSSLTNLEVGQVNSECLQFGNDIYDQQMITEALNALEPEQIIWLNQSLDQLLVGDNYNCNLTSYFIVGG